MEIKVIYGNARGRVQIRRGLIKWKNAARRRLCRNNGPTIPQAPASPSTPKPISSVLAWFYHGAVYHRLPRQCRCCSHCTAHGDAVVTYILLPNTPTRRIKHVGTTMNLSAHSRGNGTVERQTEGRQFFLPRAALRVANSYREQSRYYRQEGSKSHLAAGSRQPEIRGEKRVKWRKNGESARLQNYGRLITSSRN